MSIEFRKLTRQDMAAYKELRLLGLKESPYAFGSSLEEEQEKSEDEFFRMASNIYIIGAFKENKLIGVAGIYKDTGVKRRHRATIWGVYTHPEFRGQSIGKRLIDEILSHIPAEVEQIHLGTWEHNHAAIKIYTDSGFETYGLDKNALRWDGKDYHELKMVKFLK